TAPATNREVQRFTSGSGRTMKANFTLFMSNNAIPIPNLRITDKHGNADYVSLCWHGAANPRVRDRAFSRLWRVLAGASERGPTDPLGNAARSQRWRSRLAAGRCVALDTFQFGGSRSWNGVARLQNCLCAHEERGSSPTIDRDARYKA